MKQRHLDERTIYRRGEVVRLTRAGYSLPQIAAYLRITERSVQRHREKAGISQPPPTRMSEDEIAAARALLEDGASYSEVVRSTGRARPTLQHHLPGYGWSQSMASEYRHLRERLDQLRPVLESA